MWLTRAGGPLVRDLERFETFHETGRSARLNPIVDVLPRVCGCRANDGETDGFRTADQCAREAELAP
jgi:hypothetical protein